MRKTVAEIPLFLHVSSTSQNEHISKQISLKSIMSLI